MAIRICVSQTAELLVVKYNRCRVYSPELLYFDFEYVLSLCCMNLKFSSVSTKNHNGLQRMTKLL